MSIYPPTGTLEIKDATLKIPVIDLQYTSNTAKIEANSNVVTEFPRSKKLIKYPRVAIANGNTMASGAGVQTPGLSGSQDGFVATSSSNWGGGGADSRAAWCAFDEGTSSTTHKLWQSGNYYTTATPGVYNRTPPQSHTADGVNYEGEWIKLELPHKINVSTIEINSAAYATLTGHHTARPYEGAILGSNNDTNWSLLKSFSGGLSWTTTTVAEGGSRATLTPDANTTNYYKYLMLVVNKNQGSRVSVDINEIRYYGIPEYDPEAHGTDVVVKSVPNVPNTDWLEVYYDAKNYTSGVVQDESTPQRNGTIITGVTSETVDGIKSFKFAGANNNNIISTAMSLPSGSGAASLSVAVWFKRTVTNTTGLLFTIGNGGGNTAPHIYINSSQGMVLDWWDNNVNVLDKLFLTDRWYHLVYTYSGGSHAQGSSIFIDGEPQALGPASDGGSILNLDGSDVLTIGSYPSGSYPFTGNMANFRLFNRALTSDEIYQLYAYQKEYFGHGDLSMTLKAGRLGIGTSEPKAALDVRGDVNVGGLVNNVGMHWFISHSTGGNVAYTPTGGNWFSSTASSTVFGTVLRTENNAPVSAWNSSNGYFTAPEDGLYLIDLALFINGFDTGRWGAFQLLEADGTLKERQYTFYTANLAADDTVGYSKTVYMKASESFAFYTTQGTVTLFLSGGPPGHTTMNIYKIS